MLTLELKAIVPSWIYTQTKMDKIGEEKTAAEDCSSNRFRALQVLTSIPWPLSVNEEETAFEISWNLNAIAWNHSSDCSPDETKDPNDRNKWRLPTISQHEKED